MENSIEICLPDGANRQLNANATVADLAASISSNLLKKAIAGRVNGTLVDLSTPLKQKDKVEIITDNTEEGLTIIRHSTAHLMAMAIQEIFPGTQITIGPVVENQFYYDIKPPENKSITPEDLGNIEKKMLEIANKKIPFKRKVVSRNEAIQYFTNLGETFKVELIQDIPETEEVKIYEINNWGDLCRGPHVPNTEKLVAFKLQNISGAYWRANKDNAQLTRIYGTAFANKKDLEAHLHMLEEAKKRDHLVIGKQLDLFSMQPDIAVGAPFFHPNGARLFILLQNYMRKKTVDGGYKEVITPQVMNVNLWKISGHYDFYKENMYLTKIDDLDYGIKPMNCPGHVRIFTSNLRSYRDLPLRMSEFGVVHRHELSGVVRGLTRVRRFMQDDAHIFCTLEQVEHEIKLLIKMVKEVYSDLGFNEVIYHFSTRPKERMGSDEMWDIAEKALENSMRSEGITFILNPGDGAFYGPKIDFKIRDAIGRLHQCATIQADFQLPGRFGATYVSQENKHETPIMIHRAILGSLERFMGVFIENTAGHFPVGLSPIQVRIINVSDSQLEYAKQLEQFLLSKGVRVECDTSNEKLGYKIRAAQLLKTPYMLVVGEKEVAANTVAARFHDGKQLDPMSWDSFYSHIKQESGVFWGLDVNQH